MRSQKSKTSDQIAKNHHVTLLELLDRLLDKGVMVKGEILLSVADVDLVYLNLGLLLSSVKTIENAINRDGHGEAELTSRQTSSEEAFLDTLQLDEESKDVASTSLPEENSRSRNEN